MKTYYLKSGDAILCTEDGIPYHFHHLKVLLEFIEKYYVNNYEENELEVVQMSDEEESEDEFLFNKGEIIK